MAPARTINVAATSNKPGTEPVDSSSGAVPMVRDGLRVDVAVLDVEAHGRMGWKIDNGEPVDPVPSGATQVVRVTPEALAASRIDE